MPFQGGCSFEIMLRGGCLFEEMQYKQSYDCMKVLSNNIFLGAVLVLVVSYGYTCK